MTINPPSAACVPVSTKTKWLAIVDAPPNQLITRRIRLAIVSGCRRQMELHPADQEKVSANTNLQEARGQYNCLSNLELGLILASWREKRDLSLRQLAKELDISYQSLRQYEKGRKRMPRWIFDAFEESKLGMIQVQERPN